jgi:hypothetical protein
LIVVFLTVTAATSAEMVAVSSIFTWDIYRTYIVKGEITAHQSEKANRIIVAGYVIIMGSIACILNVAGIGLGWLYLWMGVVIGACVLPLALTVMWKGTNKYAALVAPLVGLCCGLTAWLVAASQLNGGVVSVSTTGQPLAMLCGNLTSIVVGGLIVIIWSLIKPANYDFDTMRSKFSSGGIPTEEEMGELKKHFNFATIAAITLAIIFLIIIPFPLFFSSYVFSPGFFTAWVVIGVIWMFGTGFGVVLYPLYEGRRGLKRNCGGLFWDAVKCNCKK